jgi:hypothetical protein
MRPARAAASVRFATPSVRSRLAVRRLTVRSETCSALAIWVVLAPPAMSVHRWRSLLVSGGPGFRGVGRSATPVSARSEGTSAAGERDLSSTPPAPAPRIAMALRNSSTRLVSASTDRHGRTRCIAVRTATGPGAPSSRSSSATSGWWCCTSTGADAAWSVPATTRTAPSLAAGRASSSPRRNDGCRSTTSTRTTMLPSSPADRVPIALPTDRRTGQARSWYRSAARPAA